MSFGTNDGVVANPRSILGIFRSGIGTPTLVYGFPTSRFPAVARNDTVTAAAMGILHRIDRRREPRRDADLTVTVWGIDTRGERFVQHARAREISRSGALLSGLDLELRSGDVLGVLYAGKKARYRVIWVQEFDEPLKMQAAIHRIEPDLCPWEELLAQENVSPT